MQIFSKEFLKRLSGKHKIKINFLIYILYFALCPLVSGEEKVFLDKVRIKAIGIPLADHYAGIVAFEKYRNLMKYANYQLILLPGPELVAAYFRSEPDADVAFNVSPLIMDMFKKKPTFRWVSLIHRDGNALAINDLMNEVIKLNQDKLERNPDNRVADSLIKFKAHDKTPVVCAVPSALATHTTILYKYLKDHGKTLGFINQDNVDVILTIVKPAQSPAFLKSRTTRKIPAMFQQSLPWPEIADSSGQGHVAWYSKDVMPHPKGHVECIIIAKNDVIEMKRKALKEVIYYIHKAGQDIEVARRKGGPDLEEIIEMIQRQIPQHTRDSVIETLRPDLMSINYMNLNVDIESKDSFTKIMELAYEAGFIKNKIDVQALADESFATKITLNQP